mmetsp:Transcript_6525/g.20509  ORF Transcript_6525/g.20509 Transcript_6525/m.20509 type:complete len:495 (+) Transcript_6525:880-2364(+)
MPAMRRLCATMLSKPASGPSSSGHDSSFNRCECATLACCMPVRFDWSTMSVSGSGMNSNAGTRAAAISSGVSCSTRVAKSHKMNRGSAAGDAQPLRCVGSCSAHCSPTSSMKRWHAAARSAVAAARCPVVNHSPARTMSSTIDGAANIGKSCTCRTVRWGCAGEASTAAASSAAPRSDTASSTTKEIPATSCSGAARAIMDACACRLGRRIASRGSARSSTDIALAAPIGSTARVPSAAKRPSWRMPAVTRSSTTKAIMGPMAVDSSACRRVESEAVAVPEDEVRPDPDSAVVAALERRDFLASLPLPAARPTLEMRSKSVVVTVCVMKATATSRTHPPACHTLPASTGSSAAASTCITTVCAGVRRSSVSQTRRLNRGNSGPCSRYRWCREHNSSSENSYRELWTRIKRELGGIVPALIAISRGANTSPKMPPSSWRNMSLSAAAQQSVSSAKAPTTGRLSSMTKTSPPHTRIATLKSCWVMRGTRTSGGRSR